MALAGQTPAFTDTQVPSSTREEKELMALAGQTPKFTDSFLVEENNYGDFIRVVRQHVIGFCKDRRGDGIVQPVLPPEQAVPSLWFHVVLRNKRTMTPTSSRFITLAIRMDNLYVIGFRTAAGVWWEFTEKGRHTHFIANSKWLGFGGGYPELIDDRGLETVPIGRAQMVRAVDILAMHGTGKMSSEEELQVQGARADHYAVPKSMLVKLVIMISEGLRFTTVSGTVDAKFDAEKSAVTAMEGKQAKKWKRICEGVFKWAKDPTAKLPELEKLGVKNKTEAGRIVALVKYQKL